MIKYWLTVPTLSAMMLVPSIGEVSAEKSKAEQLYDKIQQCDAKFSRDITNCSHNASDRQPGSPCREAASLAKKICEHDAGRSIAGKRM